MAPSFTIRVNEKTTFKYTGTMKDENNVALGPSDIATLTCTMYDEDTGAIINNRNNQNILNANSWTLSGASSANLTWDAPLLDSPIVDDSKETEIHIVLLKWTYGPGAIYEGTKQIAVRVVNLARIT